VKARARCSAIFQWLASKSRWKVYGQELKLGTDVIWVSSQWFVGDDANQNPKLSDYWVANLHGSYQLTKELQIYGFVNDLFNRKFATFGTFFRSAIDGRDRDTERALRPPHGHAGAAALGLCGDACKAVRPANRQMKTGLV
jgi:outer membrane receptor for ferrienterochelin and colicin